VFTGFTLSQSGLVVHWRRTRPPCWRYRASLNGLGAATTALATVVFLLTNFTEGAWVVVLAVPAFIAVRPDVIFARVPMRVRVGNRVAPVRVALGRRRRSAGRTSRSEDSQAPPGPRP